MPPQLLPLWLIANRNKNKRGQLKWLLHQNFKHEKKDFKSVELEGRREWRASILFRGEWEKQKAKTFFQRL